MDQSAARDLRDGNKLAAWSHQKQEVQQQSKKNREGGEQRRTETKREAESECAADERCSASGKTRLLHL